MKAIAKQHSSRQSAKTQIKRPLHSKRTINSATKRPTCPFSPTPKHSRHFASQIAVNECKRSMPFPPTLDTIQESTRQSDLSLISRRVDAIMPNIPQPEGHGVTVSRSIGRQPHYYSPFALLDHFSLPRNSKSQGTGFPPHYHYGISTLTYVLEGSILHQDHLGNAGLIKKGGAQFMSAGAGIVHSETAGTDDPASGLQLWINLESWDKDSDPKYQEYQDDELPRVYNDGIMAKIIAGKAFDQEAKIITNTPVHYVHYTMEPYRTLEHRIPHDFSALLFSFHGEGYVGDEAHCQSIASHVSGKKTVLFNQDDDSADIIRVTTGKEPFEFILIAGRPLQDGQPVIQRGPVIVNNREQLMRLSQQLQHNTGPFEGAREFINSFDHTLSFEEVVEQNKTKKLLKNKSNH